MSAMVLLSLPLSLLAVGMLVVVAFADGAFRSLSFAGQAERFCSPRPSQKFPMRELMTTAGRLIDENSLDAAQLVCPETPFIPQVTEPEAKAIASEVKHRGPVEVNRVLEQSRAANGFCPMRLKSGLCACATIRPLDCISRCLAGADSPEWVAGLGDSLSTAFRHHLETHHADGATRGLDQALLATLDSPPPSPAFSRQ